MRNAVIGGLMGMLLGCGVLMACGGSGSSGSTHLGIGQAILAAAHVDAVPGTATVTRQFNHMAPPVTVTRLGVGSYSVDFGFDVSDRFFSICVGRHDSGSLARDRVATFEPHPVDPNVIIVVLWATSTAAQTDQGHFYVSVFG